MEINGKCKLKRLMQGRFFCENYDARAMCFVFKLMDYDSGGACCELHPQLLGCVNNWGHFTAAAPFSFVEVTGSNVQ
jgi:hypothetical protein